MNEDSYLDTYWEDQYDVIDYEGDLPYDEVNFDPYAGCDVFEIDPLEDLGLDEYDWADRLGE